jgi:hypothetical protein
MRQARSRRRPRLQPAQFRIARIVTGTPQHRALEPADREDQDELQDHDQDQRREVERAADGRHHAPDGSKEAERHRIERAGERTVGSDP